MDLTKQLYNAIKLIDRWLEYKVYICRIPGLSAGIAYKDKTYFSKGYGYANVERKIPTTETTGYRISSVSKVFTAVAIMQLVEQGKLHLDDRVQEYLPWFTSEYAKYTNRLSIRQLLTHIAGLERDGSTPHWIDFQFPFLEQVKQHVAEGAMIYAPLEQWKYSNFGYTVLGEVIRAASGVPYEAFVTETIIERLGLSLTTPMLTDKIVSNLAIGYGREIPNQEREIFPHIKTHAMASAIGFSSTVIDLCKFMMAQFKRNTILLTDESKREMRQIQWQCEGCDSDWCLGLQNWKINGRRIYGHSGSFPGYKSRICIDVGRQIGVVILANAIDAPAMNLALSAQHTIDYVISHFAEFEAMDKKAEHIEKYEGRYTSIWQDVDVVAINDDLIFYPSSADKPFDNFYHLRYAGDDRFMISSGDGLGNIGEPVRFEFDDEDAASRMFIGPNPHERLDQ